MRESLFARGAAHLGAAAAARKLRSDDARVRERARNHLATRLGKLRGLPRKLGQLVSLTEGGESFDALREGADALPWPQIARRLTALWGCAPEDHLDDVEQAGIAASLGQVHRARLKDGRDVAVKVAYPGIEKATRADLKLLGWWSSAAPKRGLFDLEAYKREISRDLEEELDYRQECANQLAYAEAFSADREVVIPEVIDDLSGEGVLVTTWEDGADLETAATWSIEDRQALARRVISHFTRAWFEHGLVHGDLHPGNYRFRQEPGGPRLVLFDFGSMLRLDERARLLLLRLLDAAMRDDGDPFAILAAMGFDRDLLEPIRSRLPGLCKAILEPFTTRGPFNLEGWNRGERAADILGDERWNLRCAGPASMILVMRAFWGLIHILERLDVAVPWQPPVLEQIRRQAGALAALPLPLDEVIGFEALAAHLCIRVTQDGVETVMLKMPASAVERLPSLLDPDVERRVRARGLDPQDIVRSARRSGYASGDLLSVDDPTTGRSVRMWLD